VYIAHIHGFFFYIYTVPVSYKQAYIIMAEANNLCQRLYWKYRSLVFINYYQVVGSLGHFIVAVCVFFLKSNFHKLQYQYRTLIFQKGTISVSTILRLVRCVKCSRDVTELCNMFR